MRNKDRPVTFTFSVKDVEAVPTTEEWELAYDHVADMWREEIDRQILADILKLADETNNTENDDETND